MQSAHVFLHPFVELRALHSLLQGQLPEFRVEAFGRHRDFQESLQANPAAVFAVQPVLSSLSLPVSIRGTNSGRDREPYSILSTHTVEPSSIGTVGAVDLMGRRQMPTFIASLLPHAPRVELVTKAIDLVSLLRFGKVEGVVIPDRQVREAQEMTNIPLTKVPLPGADVGLAAISVMSGGDAKQVRAALSRISGEVLRVIGVSRWQ